MTDANVWNEGTSISGNTMSAEESFTADGDTNVFTLTNFSYAVGTGALSVFVNGVRQVKNSTWGESTTSTFYVSGIESGDIITAVGNIGIEGDVSLDTLLEIAVYYDGTVATETKMFTVVMASAANFSADLSGSQAYASTVTDGYEIVLNLYQNSGDTPVGYITFSDGESTGVFTTEDEDGFSCEAGDVFDLYSGTVSDTYDADTLAGVAITLQATVDSSVVTTD